jgi:hypothetical protein
MPSSPGRSRFERFDALVRRSGANSFIEIPRDVTERLKPFAHAGRIRAAGKMNGATVQGTLIPVRKGAHRFYVNGGMRAAARISVGDVVAVSLRAIPPTEVVIAADLEAALRTGDATEAFESCPPSRRRELVRYIDDARTADSRRRRIQRTIEHLLGRESPPAASGSRRAHPMWTCPKCGNQFVTRNMFHSCGRHDLGPVFQGKPPAVRQLFERFRALVEACGPVTPVVYRDKVGYMVRVRFAAATPRKQWLEVGFWLRRRLESPRIDRIETLSPNVHIHRMRVTTLAELDAELDEWLRESYEIGCQQA